MMVHKLWFAVLVGCLPFLLVVDFFPGGSPACFVLAVVQYFFEILSLLPTITIY